LRDGFDFAQPFGLTPNELDLLKAYRFSNDQGREAIRCNAQSQAEDRRRDTCSVPCPTDGVSHVRPGETHQSAAARSDAC
jgi:hypothetical protein